MCPSLGSEVQLIPDPSFLCPLPGWKQGSPYLCGLFHSTDYWLKMWTKANPAEHSGEILKPKRSPSLACCGLVSAPETLGQWPFSPTGKRLPQSLISKTSVARSKNSLSETLTFNSALQSEEMHLSINPRILSRRNSKRHPGKYVWNHRSLMSRWHSMNTEHT